MDKSRDSWEAKGKQMLFCWLPKNAYVDVYIPPGCLYSVLMGRIRPTCCLGVNASGKAMVHVANVATMN